MTTTDRPTPSREHEFVVERLGRLVAEMIAGPGAAWQPYADYFRDLLPPAADALDAPAVRSSEWRHDPKVLLARIALEDATQKYLRAAIDTTLESEEVVDSLIFTMDALCDAVASAYRVASDES